MGGFADEIIEKMGSEEYPDLNFEFIYKLSNESQRGAVLIGVSKLEEYFDKLILHVLPSKVKAYTSRLLKYPGPISSFSGKIELLFAFRIIDKRFYNSVNVLRKVRNKAAHSSESFNFDDFETELEEILNFDEEFSEIIQHLALDNLIKLKKRKVKKILDSKEIGRSTYNEMWIKSTTNLHENPEVIKQLKLWKFSYGLTFMCLMINVLIDKYDVLKKKNLTWLEIIEE